MSNFNHKIPNIQKTIITSEMVCNRNCENFLGAAQVPLGIAGPLQLTTHNLQLTTYLPLATTEGALVASVNRGCKATRLSGGVKVLTESVGATRGPVFRTENIKESFKLKKWLDENFSLLEKTASKTSPYLSLRKLGTRFVGRDVYVRFYFETGEAMGMNMVTLSTQKLVYLIKERLKIKCLSLSGNFCIDKKPAWLNFISGRGKRVWAETIIKEKIVRNVLKTSSEQIIKVVNKKCLLGSAMAGSLGFNAHFANIVAALFLATGQDLAHVVEGSLGVTVAELQKKGDLYFSIYLPSLMVGVVGGGTGLPTQKEALKILGFEKPKKGDSLRLAEIIGAAVLCGELSLTASLAAGHLTKAHERLGRGGIRV